VHVRFGERAWETDSGDTARRPCPTQPEVKLWGLWPIHVFVAIDHYSRKVVSVTPLEGPNSGWIIDALELAFEKYGSPKHIISDQDCVFTGAPFKDLLKKWNVKPRLGAVGKHGSISVTERVNISLKYEWLKLTPILKGFDHLESLCSSFVEWYNEWRPHMSLDGARPDDVFYDKNMKRPEHDAKAIPYNIELKLFRETRVTGYRLGNVA